MHKWVPTLKENNREELIKVAIYCLEDCEDLKGLEEYKVCMSMLRRWKEVTKEEVDKCNPNDRAIFHAVKLIKGGSEYCASIVVYHCAQLSNQFSEKYKEYHNYAKLFLYEDRNYHFKEKFNLDNDDELNIFLDFLTDNYPTAITFKREEYFTKKLAREYLREIYQCSE